MQRLAFLSAFLLYLQTESLVTREQTAELIGGMVYHSDPRMYLYFTFAGNKVHAF